MKNKIYVQVSLDVMSVEEALGMARSAVSAGVDWLEAGTPLILSEGLRSVKALRSEFPGIPVVADLKTMDGAGLEAEMMIRAGANYVVVMSQAHWASIKEMVRMAHSMGAYVMADILNAPNKAEEAKRMEELGADWIIVHTGFDERNHIRGCSPLNDLPEVLKSVGIPVQAVGGLSVEDALKTVRMGAASIVIGAPYAIQNDRFATAKDFELILRDIVGRVALLKR